jgi:hypothetical protein
VDRIIDSFPADQQDRARAALGCAAGIGPRGTDVDESGLVFFCTVLDFII